MKVFKKILFGSVMLSFLLGHAYAQRIRAVMENVEISSGSTIRASSGTIIAKNLIVTTTVQADVGNFNTVYTSTIQSKSPLIIKGDRVDMVGAMTVQNTGSENVISYIKANSGALAIAISSGTLTSGQSRDPTDGQYSVAITSDGKIYAKDSLSAPRVNVSTITFTGNIIIPSANANLSNITNSNNVILGFENLNNNYNNSISIGKNVHDNYTYGIGIGNEAHDNYTYGIGIGNNVYNNCYIGIGIGNEAHDNYSAGIGIGYFARNNCNQGIGIGYNTYNNYNSGVGIGNNAYANHDYGVGIGAYAFNNHDYAVGIGAFSQNNQPYSTSVGAYSFSATSSVALGYNAKANAQNSIAIGAGTINNSTGTASFGDYAIYTSSSISANYLTSSKFFIGEVYVSSTTYPAFYGCWDFTRDTITIVGVRAYAVYSSTVNKTEFDICYSSTSQGTSWYSIFTSTVPWIGANATTSDWFVPDIQTLYPDYSFAPRIISIPASGTLPNIAIEVKYWRRTDK